MDMYVSQKLKVVRAMPNIGPYRNLS